MTRASRPSSATVDAQARQVSARARTVGVWAAQILLALFFVVASVPKLVGTRQAVEQVRMLGFGDWFRYLIGLCELGGAVGLVIPRLSGLAAAGLAAVMVGATIADLLVLPNPPALPAALSVACAAVAWVRWPETRARLRAGWGEP